MKSCSHTLHVPPPPLSHSKRPPPPHCAEQLSFSDSLSRCYRPAVPGPLFFVCCYHGDKALGKKTCVCARECVCVSWDYLFISGQTSDSQKKDLTYNDEWWHLSEDEGAPSNLCFLKPFVLARCTHVEKHRSQLLLTTLSVFSRNTGHLVRVTSTFGASSRKATTDVRDVYTKMKKLWLHAPNF